MIDPTVKNITECLFNRSKMVKMILQVLHIISRIQRF